MSETEFSKRPEPASRPPGFLNADAFGVEAYRPDAYGSAQVAGEAPRYRATPKRRKTLDEITAAADLKKFAPRKSRLRLSWALGAGALVAVALVGIISVASTESATGDEPQPVPGESLAALAAVPSAPAPEPTTVASREAVEEPTVVTEKLEPSPEPSGRTVSTAEVKAAVEPRPRTEKALAVKRSPTPVEASRSERYRTLRIRLRSQLVALDISGSAKSARALLSTGENLDWEALRWAARAIRMNGDLRQAAELYGQFARMFPTNRYRRRALQWQASLTKKLNEMETASDTPRSEDPMSALSPKMQKGNSE
ncbi:MAG: hypothetical protein AAF654_10745 [Myxococcota bacterium]